MLSPTWPPAGRSPDPADQGQIQRRAHCQLSVGGGPFFFSPGLTGAGFAGSGGEAWSYPFSLKPGGSLEKVSTNH
jgi:hypothetical protein